MVRKWVKILLTWPNFSRLQALPSFLSSQYLLETWQYQYIRVEMLKKGKILQLSVKHLVIHLQWVSQKELMWPMKLLHVQRMEHSPCIMSVKMTQGCTQSVLPIRFGMMILDRLRSHCKQVEIHSFLFPLILDTSRIPVIKPRPREQTTSILVIQFVVHDILLKTYISKLPHFLTLSHTLLSFLIPLLNKQLTHLPFFTLKKKNKSNQALSQKFRPPN